VKLIKLFGIAMIVSGLLWVAGGRDLGRSFNPPEVNHPLSKVAAGATASQPPHRSQANSTGWRFHSKKSLMDDTTKTWIEKQSIDVIGVWPTSTSRPELAFSCNPAIPNPLEMYVWVGTSAEPEYGGDYTIRYRLDARPAETERAIESDNREALFFGDRELIESIISGGAKTLTFEFTAFNTGVRTARFNLAGLHDAARTYLANCLR
jgi:hypothetical protein